MLYQPDPLTREIIRRIFANIGILPPPRFGQSGIVVEDLRISQTIDGIYENGEKFSYPIFSGEIRNENFLIQGLVCDISEQNSEYAVLFRTNEKHWIGLRLSYDSEEAIFLILNDLKIWVQASVYHQANILKGMELLVSSGLLWQSMKGEDLAILIPYLRSLVEI